jgi:hypothetical protein
MMVVKKKIRLHNGCHNFHKIGVDYKKLSPIVKSFYQTSSLSDTRFGLEKHPPERPRAQP